MTSGWSPRCVPATSARSGRSSSGTTPRDVEGCSAVEVCDLLGLTEANQGVLLHRARSKVRRALELELDLDLDL
jgi:hypothetical protein